MTARSPATRSLEDAAATTRLSQFLRSKIEERPRFGRQRTASGVNQMNGKRRGLEIRQDDPERAFADRGRALIVRDASDANAAGGGPHRRLGG
jgi:hypothetical protein